MPYYFEKFCFDYQKISVRNECNMFACEGNYSDFGLFFIKQMKNIFTA